MSSDRVPQSNRRTRREILAYVVMALAAAACGTRPPAAPTSLAELEARIGGRVGVFALDTGSGRALAHRADERFAMCSTFKWVLAAHVLAEVDRGALALDEPLRYSARDLIEHAPVASAHVLEGSLSVALLAEAAVTVSDNTAANLLLARTGGPAAVTAFARARGDAVTRLDRDEPSLNEHALGDPRDTTTPRAMVGLLRAVLVGDALTPTSRERLLGWLRACETGRTRLRAGFPAGWTAGDKTGTGPRGAVNDLAIAWPPSRAPILVAAYLSESPRGVPTLSAAHAEIGRSVADALGG